MKNIIRISCFILVLWAGCALGETNAAWDVIIPSLNYSNVTADTSIIHDILQGEKAFWITNGKAEPCAINHDIDDVLNEKRYRQKQ